MRLLLFLSITCLNAMLCAQVSNTATLDTTGGQHIGNITVGAYADIYYGYDFSEPVSSTVNYFVSSSRHNEFNINLAFLDLRYQSAKLRIRVVPGFGTYMNANYANEPGTLRNLVEANAGLLLSEKKKIWIDAGVLGSPYTNESAISKDHLMYTRSLAPEYVPYYLSGIKITLPAGKKLNFYLYIINGWQQIIDQNKGKALGTQVEFRPNANHLINWNTYAGDQRAAFTPLYRNRYFTDIYWLYNAGKRWSFASCAYAGRQDWKTNAGTGSYYWWQANFTASFALSPKFSLASRVEYFSDQDQAIIDALSAEGFEGGSAGLGITFKATDKALIRLEGRHFLTTADQFLTNSGAGTNTLTWLTASFTAWF